MINPHQITNFKRTVSELQEFLLFCIIVAGKTAVIQASKLQEFLDESLPSQLPFSHVKYLIDSGQLSESLKDVKMGQYNRLEKSFKGVLGLDLGNCTVTDLMAVPGIGAKTANFFLLHSRENHTGVILDTHILKHLVNNGIQAPKSTPTNIKLYNKLEVELTNLWKKEEPEMTLAEYDLMLWKKYTKTKDYSL